ncbi:MEKHLA domain-containing protein [Novosphingobium sp. G106]|uniref:MEKHLA domain-containing protein n=1 Tax=Novosphingobium sp. G106 TaxID=2849500 RepID=UPI0020C1FB41|nr:MEKHLA domain-containing protein [Novosphingobium sp. G106]
MDRIALIATSFERLLGRSLVAPGDDVVTALWNAPDAVVAHGIEADPIFFFGNRAALAAFETDVVSFTALPSRLSAEAPQREERQMLLDRVSQDGFIDDYAGLRISATGRRFRIEQAIVWNLIDAEGIRQGQAATFTV